MDAFCSFTNLLFWIQGKQELGAIFLELMETGKLMGKIKFL